MKVIKPNQSVTVSQNTAVNADPDYSASTTYSVGSRVTSGNDVYQSLTAGNTGNDTSDGAHWVKAGVSNRYAMFDTSISTQTTATNSLTVTFSAAFADSVYIGNVDAQSVRVRMVGDGVEVFNELRNLSGDVGDWYEYFFNDPEALTKQVIFNDLPNIFGNAEITVEFSGSAIAVGAIVAGPSTDLGISTFGAKPSITDYSRKETDEFGNTQLVKRAFSKRLSCSVVVDALRLNRVALLLQSIRSEPVVWILSELPEHLETGVIFGFYRDFYLSIETPSVATCELEIEGLI